MESKSPPGKSGTNTKIKCGDVELDLRAGVVWCGGLPARLTPKESALLAVLLAAPGRVFTRAALLDMVWQVPCGGALRTRTVDMHIRHLRQKLGRGRIETVFRCGYRWNG